MTFDWTGNIGKLSDEDIIAIVADMRDEGFVIYDVTVGEHLGRIDPEGTLNISAVDFLERAKGLEA